MSLMGLAYVILGIETPKRFNALLGQADKPEEALGTWKILRTP
jgi:hypothetical protein